MIYLSGRLAAAKIGVRKDIGIMETFRPGCLSRGKTQHHEVFWAADNGCFKNPHLDVTAYLHWLKELQDARETCLFAVAPDVVGDAATTWEKSKEVLPLIRALGFPAAFVAQDGIETQTIHWNEFDCLFLGGTDQWKLSANNRWLCREATERGKWVHMGRVNSMRRMALAKFWGCHSVDGTGLVYAPDRRLEQLERWLDYFKGSVKFGVLTPQ